MPLNSNNIMGIQDVYLFNGHAEVAAEVRQIFREQPPLPDAATNLSPQQAICPVTRYI
jgi:hypothetical protein